jgi:hypothetical protein
VGFLDVSSEEDSLLIAARTMFSTLDKVTVCYGLRLLYDLADSLLAQPKEAVHC